nr:RNA polymerase sigma factor SigM [Mycobacterium sp. MS1601]
MPRITAETARSDADLLAAHAAGDPHAFGELFRRYHTPLIRFARKHSRCREDAADAVQEAMLAVHRGAPTFRSHSTVGTWLFRIVSNKCVDQRRRDQRWRAFPGDRDWEVPVDPCDAIPTTHLIHLALALLPVDQRAAVVAVDMQGYAVADAARLLGVPAGTVKSRCARGRAKLAVLLADADARN